MKKLNFTQTLSVKHEAHIIPYLQKYRHLPLPGIGVISAERVQARLNYADGSIKPPALELQFEENPSQKNASDNRADFQKNWSLLLGVENPENDTNSLEAFSKEILEKLKAEKVITLCNLIRFYMDSSGKIQFRALDYLPMPDMFGLPDLSYFPVSRTAVEKKAIHHTDAVAVGTVVASKKPKRKPARKTVVFGWKSLASAAAVLVLVLASVTVLNFFSERTTFQTIPVSEHMLERLNKKPSEVQEAAPHAALPLEETKSETSLTDELDENTEEALNLPYHTDDPLSIVEKEAAQAFEEIENSTDSLYEITETKQAKTGSIIFIELLCNDNNVTRLVNRIEADTFASFTRPRGRCTQVGIYSGSVHDNLNTALSIIREKYNDQAFVE